MIYATAWLSRARGGEVSDASLKSSSGSRLHALNVGGFLLGEEGTPGGLQGRVGGGADRYDSSIYKKHKPHILSMNSRCMVRQWIFMG